MAQNWWEAQGSPTEETNESGWSGTMTVHCAWADRYTVDALFLSGGGMLWPHNPNWTINQPHARTSIIRPIGKSQILDTSGSPTPSTMTGIGRYEEAELVITFRMGEDAPENCSQGGQWVSESMEPVIEFQTLDYTKFSWSSKIALCPISVALSEKSAIPKGTTRGL
jgi:hypothetical protein